MHTGHITEAINLVNDMHSFLLDDNPQLMFHLRLQQLIETIRDNDIDRALDFARVCLVDDVFLRKRV